MPHQRPPEHGSGDAPRGVPARPRPADPRQPGRPASSEEGRPTAAPDAPQVPRPRYEAPSRPPRGMVPPGPQSRGDHQARPPATRTMPPSAAADLVPARGPAGPGGPNGPIGGGPGDGGRGGDGSGGGTQSLKAELSPTKVAAGAGAAVVTAILGSFLGAVGTVLGAALGSIITTVATTFFTRSLEHTKTKTVELKERAASLRGRGGPGAEGGPAAAASPGVGGPTGEETVLLDPSQAPGRPASAKPRRRLRMGRKSIVLAVVGGLIAFGVAMFLVTGIEFVKGSTITGGNTGTSIGNVVSGNTAPATQDSGQDTTGDQSSDSPTSTSEESATGTSESSTSTEDSGSQQDGQDEQGSGSNGDSLGDQLNRVVPTQQPGSGQDSGQDGSGQDGSGSGN